MSESLIIFVVCRCLKPCLLGCDMHVKIGSHGYRSYCLKPDCLYVDLSSSLTESNKMSLYAVVTNAGKFLLDNLFSIDGPFGQTHCFKSKIWYFCRYKSTLNTFSIQYLRFVLQISSGSCDNLFIPIVIKSEQNFTNKKKCSAGLCHWKLIWIKVVNFCCYLM